ncbi:hypothetical protein OH687_09015 [Burkholderia anthina]|nr:hypothetical protein OH687_09015 [Burkholderia anthina]
MKLGPIGVCRSGRFYSAIGRMSLRDQRSGNATEARRIKSDSSRPSR